MTREIEKAEYTQAVKAFAIPSSLFVATLISAAGSFLVYSGYALGWAFLGVAAAVVTGAFTIFLRFHNKLRAAGHFLDAAAEEPAERTAEHDVNGHPLEADSVSSAGAHTGASFVAH